MEKLAVSRELLSSALSKVTQKLMTAPDNAILRKQYEFFKHEANPIAYKWREQSLYQPFRDKQRSIGALVKHEVQNAYLHSGDIGGVLQAKTNLGYDSTPHLPGIKSLFLNSRITGKPAQTVFDMAKKIKTEVNDGINILDSTFNKK